MKHRQLLLLVLADTACATVSSSSYDQALANAEQLAANFVKEQGVPGLSVAAVAQTTDEGLRTWSAGYGFANVDANETVTADTSFWLGSVSKAMLGTAVMKTQEQGHINLTSRAVDVLRQAGDPLTLGDNETSHRLANMTIEHLVTHRSSIVDNYEYYVCAYFVGDPNSEYELLFDLLGEENSCVDGIPLTLAGFLEAYLSSDGLYYNQTNFIVAKPGEVEEYSNIAAGFAGYLLGLATGMALPDYASQEIFGPLGMEHTSYRSVDLDRLATPYKVVDEETGEHVAIPIYDLATYPDGGLRSSANDMAKFLGTIMNEGTLDLRNNQVIQEMTLGEEEIVLLQPETVEDMLRPRYDGETGVYWFTLSVPFHGQERKIIGHTGSDPGAFSFMFFDPVTKTGFFLASNGDDEYIDYDALIVLSNALLALADEMATGSEVPTEAPTDSPDSSAYMPASADLATMVGIAALFISL